MNIVEQVLNEVKEKCQEYKETSKDNYDFWENHLKYVYAESHMLAFILSCRYRNSKTWSFTS